MNELRFARSVESTIAEAISMVVFVPLTLARMLIRPIATYRGFTENDGDTNDRYARIAPPILCLFILAVLPPFLAILKSYAVIRHVYGEDTPELSLTKTMIQLIAINVGFRRSRH